MAFHLCPHGRHHSGNPSFMQPCPFWTLWLRGSLVAVQDCFNYLLSLCTYLNQWDWWRRISSLSTTLDCLPALLYYMFSGTAKVFSLGPLCPFMRMLVLSPEMQELLQTNAGYCPSTRNTVTILLMFLCPRKWDTWGIPAFDPQIASLAHSTSGWLAYQDTLENHFYHVSVVLRQSRFPLLYLSGSKAIYRLATLQRLALKIYGHAQVTVAPGR